jgi:outer membrane PBP1 activator LpoA protein
MARGAYTSLPYLAFHPEGYKKLSGAHWRRSYDGRVYRHAIVTRYVLGIGPEIQERIAALTKHLPESKTCDQDRDWQLEAIRDNIRKAETGETIPLPRDLLMDMQTERREQELLMRQAKYDAERESKLTEARQRATSLTTERTKEKHQKRHQAGKDRKRPKH